MPEKDLAFEEGGGLGQAQQKVGSGHGRDQDRRRLRVHERNNISRLFCLLFPKNKWGKRPRSLIYF